MRKSRIKAKLQRDEPVLVTCLHLASPALFELTSLMGFDGIWLDMEHHSFTMETAETLLRASRVGASDVFVRIARGEFMRMGRALEIGAAGIMYARCSGAAEAAEAVKWAKFAPLGTRGIDTANADAPYCTMPLADYIRRANEETFIIIQIEDPGALAEADAIAAVDGVDVLFLGPGDFSVICGIPGEVDSPVIQAAVRGVASAARQAGIHWGMPCSSREHASELLDLGARFVPHMADLIMVKDGLEKLQRDFGPLGFKFDNRLGTVGSDGKES